MEVLVQSDYLVQPIKKQKIFNKKTIAHEAATKRSFAFACTFSTCLGAGPDGIFTIFEVTSRTLLVRGKSEAELPFSGQR